MLFHAGSFGDFDAMFDRLAGLGAGSGMVMPMDAYRRGDDLWLHLDLPGVARDALELSVERGVLTISAERERYREDGDRSYMAERPCGRFRRQVHLGNQVDVDHIEADLIDGVLTIRLPVLEAAKPRRIAVGRDSGHATDAIDVESSVTG